MKRSKNCRMVEKPNSCASVAQLRLSMPKCSTASAGQACRQRLHDFTDTDLLGERPVRLKLKLGQNAGEIDARTEFRRQDIDLKPERAEPGFDAEVARGEAAVTGALIVPVGLLRGGDEGRVAGVFQFLGEAVGDLVHFAQDQHVDVLHRHIAFAAERASWNALHQHDDAFAIRRNALGRLRPTRVRREGVQRGGAGDAHQIRSQQVGATLHHGRREIL